MRNVNVAQVYNNTRENKLPFQSDYILKALYEKVRALEANTLRSEEKKMDDGLVLNIATDAPVPAKHISSKKSGRWTDR